MPHEIDETPKDRQMKYQEIVEALDRMLYFIGWQGISYRRTQETAADSDNLEIPGFFVTIVWQVTHWYHLLYEHIHSPLRKDVSYMISTSQNDLIGIVAKYILQK